MTLPPSRNPNAARTALTKSACSAGSGCPLAVLCRKQHDAAQTLLSLPRIAASILLSCVAMRKPSGVTPAPQEASSSGTPIEISLQISSIFSGVRIGDRPPACCRPFGAFAQAVRGLSGRFGAERAELILFLASEVSVCELP